MPTDPRDREETHPYGGLLHAHDPDEAVAALAGEVWGVVSTRELLACGLSERQIEARVRSARLHRLHRGVYAVGHPGAPWQGRLVAAVKAVGPGAVASHGSAAALWGFGDLDVDAYPEVLVVGFGGNRQPGIRVHRTTELTRRDRGEVQGVPVTSPARTVIDLAGALAPGHLRQLVRRAQGLRRVNERQLAEVLARLGPRRGSRRLESVLSTGPAPANSVLESVVLDLILAAGFAHPQVNAPLRLDGRIVVPDFRWPGARLIVEADGAAWHGSAQARAADMERQALLESHGERVLRVTWEQAIRRRAQTIVRLRAGGVPVLTPPA